MNPAHLNKVEKTSMSDELIAECLAHIGRPTEAIAVLQKLPYSCWRAKIEVYETLGMYQKALAACALPDANEDPYLLKIQLLLKHGERTRAIRLANSAFFLFDSPRNPHWREFFQLNGIPIPTPLSDPKAKAEILSQLIKLCAVPEPQNPSDLP
jgi:hypothetical protein